MLKKTASIVNMFKNFIFLIPILIFSFKARAYDCSLIKAFNPKGSQQVTITVSKFSWKNDVNLDEQICQSSLQIPWYDVRGREEEAYYCLKPASTEVLRCKTTLNGDDAEVQIVPASWIRNWNAKAVREYRFHAYVVKNNEPDYFYDIFSRNLQDNLKAKNITIEGSFKSGPKNPNDGFWIRVHFKKYSVKTSMQHSS